MIHAASLAYAYELTRDRWYLEVAYQLLHEGMKNARRLSLEELPSPRAGDQAPVACSDGKAFAIVNFYTNRLPTAFRGIGPEELEEIRTAQPQYRPLPQVPSSPSNPFFVLDTWFRGAESAPYTSVETQLDLARALGYDGFGCALSGPDEMRAIARSAEQKGLKLSAVYTRATLTPEKLVLDPRLDGAIEALRDHGTVIWLLIASKDFVKSSPEGDAAAVAGLRDLADSAGDLPVALYPHVGDWVERLQDAVRLARKTDRRNVGVTFNLCHCLKVGDEEAIPQLLAEATPHLFMVTINGADSGAAAAGWDRLIQPLDRGTYDLVPLLRRLADLGYAGPIGLQGYGVNGDVRENLSRSMAAWRSLSASLIASHSASIPRQ